MAFELKDGAGSLFRNNKKEKPTHPDMTGEIKIDGKVYRVSGWTKESPKAGKWLSLSVQPKDQQALSKPKSAAPKQDGQFDDDIPW